MPSIRLRRTELAARVDDTLPGVTVQPAIRLRPRTTEASFPLAVAKPGYADPERTRGATFR
jgi:hypothetical protein